MLSTMGHWKAAATNAKGDYAKMLAICEVIAMSSSAAPNQIEAAKSARRSLSTLINAATVLRAEVAEIRYEKLIILL
jgi:hypothetical protein